eukprot:scaffold27988_cov27-Prasinocladus_malaysianus.AAC.1
MDPSYLGSIRRQKSLPKRSKSSLRNLASCLSPKTVLFEESYLPTSDKNVSPYPSAEDIDFGSHPDVLLAAPEVDDWEVKNFGQRLYDRTFRRARTPRSPTKGRQSDCGADHQHDDDHSIHSAAASPQAGTQSPKASQKRRLPLRAVATAGDLSLRVNASSSAEVKNGRIQSLKRLDKEISPYPAPCPTDATAVKLQERLEAFAIERLARQHLHDGLVAP